MKCSSTTVLCCTNISAAQNCGPFFDQMIGSQMVEQLHRMMMDNSTVLLGVAGKKSVELHLLITLVIKVNHSNTLKREGDPLPKIFRLQL